MTSPKIFKICKSAFDPAEACICWQCPCIGHITYEMTTSIERVDNFVFQPDCQ